VKLVNSDEWRQEPSDASIDRETHGSLRMLAWVIVGLVVLAVVGIGAVVVWWVRHS
jgi:Tfp pilus assembly protein PilN